eukprot:1183773-Prorocentrum_minimum.AAC.1
MLVDGMIFVVNARRANLATPPLRGPDRTSAATLNLRSGISSAYTEVLISYEHCFLWKLFSPPKWTSRHSGLYPTGLAQRARKARDTKAQHVVDAHIKYTYVLYTIT